MSAEQAGGRSAYGWYAYGIVNSDVEVLDDAGGIGDPPAKVEVVRAGDIAALVSKVDLSRPIGTTADLLAHESLLDAVVVDAPALPLRFGAVLSSRDAIVDELLEPHESTFAEALRDLAGKAQYVIQARYVEAALMSEIVEENPAVLKLRGEIEGRPEEATRDIRLELGKLVNDAVEAKREGDTGTAIEAVAPVAKATALRPASHELDAAHVAVLINIAREEELESALAGLARDWDQRATIRLLGPMAPYDFVSAPTG